MIDDMQHSDTEKIALLEQLIAARTALTKLPLILRERRHAWTALAVGL